MHHMGSYLNAKQVNTGGSGLKHRGRTSFRGISNDRQSEENSSPFPRSIANLSKNGVMVVD